MIRQPTKLQWVRTMCRAMIVHSAAIPVSAGRIHYAIASTIFP